MSTAAPRQRSRCEDPVGPRSRRRCGEPMRESSTTRCHARRAPGGSHPHLEPRRPRNILIRIPWLRSCRRSSICDRAAMLEPVSALLIDLDGVLYVEEDPVEGAVDAVARLRERRFALRFVTNTTARSRVRAPGQALPPRIRRVRPGARHALRACGSLLPGTRLPARRAGDERRGQARLRRLGGNGRGGTGRDRRRPRPRVRIRRAQSGLPLRDGGGGADRPSEEPLLVARRRPVARRRAVRRRDRIRHKPGGLCRRQACLGFLRAGAR